MATLPLPKAIDLSHHLSELSRNRLSSQLKVLQKYYGVPGLISLAGGLPHPSYFPFEDLSARVQAPDAFPVDPEANATSAMGWLWGLFGSKKPVIESIVVPKYGGNDGINLATALQYGTADGLTALQSFIQEYSLKVYQPGFADVTTLVDVGNTDGWMKAVFTLCNPGDAFLADEWTYPSALTTALPLGVHVVGVGMDEQGMTPEALEEVLSGWNEVERGFKRPHVMYTVPVGQNPCGLTMRAERKKALYALCVKYDIIIVEDDPYWILQEGDYQLPSDRAKQAPKARVQPRDENEMVSAFIEDLEPSFLQYDYQGRVIRLDTFSKTIAPGARLGWFTCNPLFAERLQRQAETSTQQPCGFGQSLITQLVGEHWGMSGWLRWLQGIRGQYTMRRNLLVDEIMAQFDVTEGYGSGIWEGKRVFLARAKLDDKNTNVDEKFSRPILFTFVPPTAGMFVWVQMAFENLPQHKRTEVEQARKAAKLLSPPNNNAGPEPPNEETSLEVKLFDKIARSGLLLGPGWIFRAQRELADEAHEGHFRISFSNMDTKDATKAVAIFAKTVRAFYA